MRHLRSVDLPPFHPRRPALVAPVPVDPTGAVGPTAGEARGPYWRRTSQGLFVPAGVDGDLPEQRIVEAAAVVPHIGGVTGWAQLRWAGGSWFGGLGPDGRTARPVVLATPLTDIRSQRGIQISHEHLDDCELEWLDGLRTTSSVRSLLFEVRMARTLWQAVQAIDMAAYSDLVSIAELADYITWHVGWPGIRQARVARDLADENSWSPREVWLRLVWMMEASFPRPMMNTPVFDLAGRHVGTPDILDVQAGLAGEYEGADAHLDPETRHRDLAREDAFRSIGLEYFTAVTRDARDRAGLVGRMRSARARALWLPVDQRRWTIEPPDWWVPTRTVAQRRGLSADQRRRWLSHRR
jgi:hypothetical protein